MYVLFLHQTVIIIYIDMDIYSGCNEVEGQPNISKVKI